ncbi:MAG TPA: serine hydrolase domain-containing protein [Dinghuibacter sp.]|uniref:serine hydrolase domain-containing protein n=1 Tax=Dinghuibacter sp. TaxID=2024697 RepID=UPI002B6181E2|nr:serine hydrolase domain-containing protein [Dinghuibacter sp.]HTJ11348.1 serine hydrolase domain-containing protein [Dinghuibacter sp.]
MKKLLLLLLAFAALTSRAQVIDPHPPHLPDVNYPRLARIDTLVDTYVRNGWVKGVVTLVVRDGKLIQNKGYGFADAEAGKPMMPDELFRIASQTKAIVSTGLMMLWEEGKFYLDEPISDFMPAFAHMTVLDKFNEKDSSYTTKPAKRGITFRDLLTHTSGLDYALIGTPSMRAIYAKAGIPSGLGVIDADLKERMNALAALPLGSQPGEKWTYSLSVDLAGCLVEVISGKDLETFLRERLFNPLGMKDTYFNVPAAKAARLAAVYTEDDQHHIVRWTAEKTGVDAGYPLARKRYFSGGAGLTSTAFDYAVFLQMMLNHGVYNGVRVLAPRTVELMTSGQLDFLYNGSDNFGLGFGLTSARSAARGGRNEGSFSWGGYFGTTYWADPKAHLVCLIMTQQTPNSHGDLAAKFEDVVYQSLQ